VKLKEKKTFSPTHLNHVKKHRTITKVENTRKTESALRESFTSGAERWNSLTAYTQHVATEENKNVEQSEMNVKLLRAAPDIGKIVLVFPFSRLTQKISFSCLV
jgi:FKBP-type peptidyl-prolyl cis-trans isomerase (trigger factor)